MSLPACEPQAQPTGDGGGEQPGWAGAWGDATRTLISSAEWQADGMEDAGEPGAGSALPEREGQHSSERDRRAPY